jgi:hypothetical protein
MTKYYLVKIVAVLKEKSAKYYLVVIQWENGLGGLGRFKRIFFDFRA